MLGSTGCQPVVAGSPAGNILSHPDSRTRFKKAHLGRGYVEKFPGSRGLRDTEHNVAIDVLIAGDYPGDGRAKPVVK